MGAQNCPGREAIAAYCAGRLPQADSESVEAHMDSCRRCQAVLKEVGQSEDILVWLLRRARPVLAYQQERECRQALAKAKALVCPETQTSATTGPRRAGPPPTESYGEYRLQEKLGEGGMGRVYRAQHMRLKRPVALKVLHTSAIQDPAAVQRFEREMEAVGRLDHPNVVRVHDARKVRGTYFLVMEVIDGADAGQILARCGRLRVADACEIIRQAARGLGHAHQHGLVHRDIKPSNMMVSRDGTVKILDLGLARLQPATGGAAEPVGRTSKRPSPTRTMAGQILGTPDYMAPEQIVHAARVDIRADIYSLGCTLFALLAGQPPFAAPEHRDKLAKLNAHVELPPPPIEQFRPDVPAQLAHLIRRMLAKSPEQRPGTPREVSRTIAPFTGGANLPALVARAVPAGKKMASRVLPQCTTSPQRHVSTGGRASKKWRGNFSIPLGRNRRILLSFAVGIVSLLILVVAAIKLKTPGGGEVALRAPGGPVGRAEREGAPPMAHPAASVPKGGMEQIESMPGEPADVMAEPAAGQAAPTEPPLPDNGILPSEISGVSGQQFSPADGALAPGGLGAAARAPAVVPGFSGPMPAGGTPTPAGRMAKVPEGYPRHKETQTREQLEKVRESERPMACARFPDQREIQARMADVPEGYHLYKNTQTGEVLVGKARESKRVGKERKILLETPEGEERWIDGRWELVK